MKRSEDQKWVVQFGGYKKQKISEKEQNQRYRGRLRVKAFQRESLTQKSSVFGLTFQTRE